MQQAREAEKRWHYSSVINERSSAWEAVKKGLKCVKLKNPLLDAIAKEQLVKTQQAAKGLAGAVAISELWRLAVAL
jgi:hypothetical protein